MLSFYDKIVHFLEAKIRHACSVVSWPLENLVVFNHQLMSLESEKALKLISS